MLYIGLLLVGVIFSFGFVLLFGPPYLPTLRKQVQVALDMVSLKPGQVLLELGCGDGKVLLAAAQRGYHVVGYELNPLLVIICLLRTWRYRKLVTVHWGNFLTRAWPRTDAIFVFGIGKIMSRLDKKIMQSITNQVNVVSFAFEFPNRQAKQERNGLRLYRYVPKITERLES